MNVHTDNVQVIRQNGKPAFAVIPYSDFLNLIGKKEQGEGETTIPHAVVGLMIENDWNLVKAWRKHLGMSQEKLAKLTGISQSAISQMEQSNDLRSGTVEKLAAAMGIAPEQLVD
ncbi:MAG TPA: XRE family transcriptional regulator [Desulfobulbus sp.]|nr:XRE family transcriptional regulator [Desulfobulbus sp.]